MSLANQLTRMPIPVQRERADAALASHGWIASAVPEIRELLAGVAGSSPYLADLILREGGWLEGALAHPEAAMAAVLTDVRAAPPDQFAKVARVAKARAALLIALADLGGAWSLEQVTGALTDLAEVATDAALTAAIHAEQRRRKLRMLPEGACAADAGLVAFAMGKMGARELNYSSDIDLIMLIDESRYMAEDWGDARPALIRVVRNMGTALSERTAEGYVFRTDFRLRPDPSVTSVALSMEAAERYYESMGRAWERAAWVKARPAAGDIDAGARFLKALRPFIWRKHLDFAAVQEAHDMRLRIRAHKRLHGPITLEGHDLKLGRGGIREIEFFTQTRQIIAGGRDRSLRLRGTVEALAALSAAGWVPGEVAEQLTRHYRSLREAEHRVQMIHDAQTHALPDTPEGIARIAALSGESVAAFRARIREVLEDVHEIAEAFFVPGDSGAVGVVCQNSAEGVLAPERLDAWEGFAALRSPRAREHFARIRPRILARLDAADRPEEAFVAFGNFIKGLPAGVQLFALFEANPHLIDLLVDVTATAPALGAYLSRNARVFDAVLAGDFFAPWPGTATLADALSVLMMDAEDDEARLDLARSWAKEWHFRIGVHLLRRLITPEEAAAEYASLAEAVICALHPLVTAMIARKHGPPPGGGAVVLGLGSLGAGRLTPDSDLDLIVIYDAPPDLLSTGPRPLPAPQWYARFTKALITALSAPMAEGRLYEADMRLRPSGNQGPVAARLAAWESYQRDGAWVWEHLALTRARPVSGPCGMRDAIFALRARLVAELGPRSDTAQVIGEVATMRARIRAAKGPGGAFEAKLGPGRMQEIELAAQAGLFLSGGSSAVIADGIAALGSLKLIDAEAVSDLTSAHRLFARLNITARLISAEPLSKGVGSAAADFICEAIGLSDMAALEQHLAQLAERADAILTALEKKHGAN